MLATGTDVHALRDPPAVASRSSLNEIAEAAKVGFALVERDLPIPQTVKDACGLLGLDPLYVANEGKLLAVVPAADADRGARGHARARVRRGMPASSAAASTSIPAWWWPGPGSAAPAWSTYRSANSSRGSASGVGSTGCRRPAPGRSCSPATHTRRTSSATAGLEDPGGRCARGPGAARRDRAPRPAVRRSMGLPRADRPGPGISDPLDARVVEAYWVGNDLLESIDSRWFLDRLRTHGSVASPADSGPEASLPCKPGAAAPRLPRVRDLPVGRPARPRQGHRSRDSRPVPRSVPAWSTPSTGRGQRWWSARLPGTA